MIQITDKSKCCGCEACVQVCPIKCIEKGRDNEGFLYPKVDAEKCINCGKCEKVCPVINQSSPKTPIASYAAKNPDEEIRLKSSSGGVFSMLAEQVINNGGVVFGARFDNDWMVVHDKSDTISGIEAFRGSKYLQSTIVDCFERSKQILDTGQEALFSGTPCQIAGLKNYLGRDYPNLLTIDIICHGVPSPLVWQNYIGQINTRKGGKNSVLSHSNRLKDAAIAGISFRDKRLGWKKYSFALTLSEAKADGEKNTVLLSSVHTQNPFMRAFLSDLILRPSCYNCPSKSGKSGSDITIADFWGIQNILPDFDDDKGANLIFINSNKGEQYFNSINADTIECDFEEAIKFNSSYFRSVKEPKYREYFFKKMSTMDIETILTKISKKNQLPLWWRIGSRVKQSLKQILK